MTLDKSYPREPVDRVLGHVPGTIIDDEVAEHRSVRMAQKVMVDRYRKHGLEGMHNFMGLVDDTTVPDFFEGPVYQERFLGTALMEEELTELARRHLGGDEGYTTQVFNRVTAGTITVTQTLVPPGSVVPYFVPPYPGLGGHGHPSVPRAIEMAQAACQEVTNLQELEDVFNSGNQVPLVVICSAYRGVVKEEETRGICELAHARGIPVYLDDASGARIRTAVFDQLPAAALGVDLVITSGEKAAFFGPRAGLLLGRADLMDRIGARANMLGTEARPSIIASFLETLRNYTDEQGQQLFSEWLERHKRLWEMAVPYMGESLRYGAYDGVYLALDDFMQLVMDKAGIDETDLAPVDASIAWSMVALRGHGFLTVGSLHYPGASKVPAVKVNSLRDGDDISDEDIIEGVTSSIDALARIMTDRAAIEKVLFAPPE